MARFFDAPVHRDESSRRPSASPACTATGASSSSRPRSARCSTEAGTFAVLVVRDRTERTARERSEIQAEPPRGGARPRAPRAVRHAVRRAARARRADHGRDARRRPRAHLRAARRHPHPPRGRRRGGRARRGGPGRAHADERPRARHGRHDPARRPRPAAGARDPRGGRHLPRGGRPDPRARPSASASSARTARSAGTWTADEVGFLESLAHLLSAAVEGEAAQARRRRDAGAAAGDPRQLARLDRDQGPRGPLPRHEPAPARGAGPRGPAGHRPHARTTSSPPRPPTRCRPTTARCCTAGETLQVEETLEHSRRAARLPHAEVPDARRGRQGLRRRAHRDGRDGGPAQRGGAPRSRGAAAPRRPPGEHRPARRRDRPRLQQPPRGHPQLRAVPHRGPAGGVAEPRGPRADPPRGRPRDVAHPAAAHLRPQGALRARGRCSSTRSSGDTERLLQRTLGEDIHLRTRLDPALPPVELDPGQAEQVLINLALNARDAMPGGGTLTISTHRGDARHRLPPRVRHRDGHAARGRRPRLRALLHVQARGQGDRPRPRDGLRRHHGRGRQRRPARPPRARARRSRSRCPRPTSRRPRSPSPTARSARAAARRSCSWRTPTRCATSRAASSSRAATRCSRRATACRRCASSRARGRSTSSSRTSSCPACPGTRSRSRLREQDPEIPIVFMSGYSDDALLGGEFADHPPAAQAVRRRAAAARGARRARPLRSAPVRRAVAADERVRRAVVRELRLARRA